MEIDSLDWRDAPASGIGYCIQHTCYDAYTDRDRATVFAALAPSTTAWRTKLLSAPAMTNLAQGFLRANFSTRSSRLLNRESIPSPWIGRPHVALTVSHRNQPKASVHLLRLSLRRQRLGRKLPRSEGCQSLLVCPCCANVSWFGRAQQRYTVCVLGGEITTSDE
jgi:hypothetical protein